MMPREHPSELELHRHLLGDLGAEEAARVAPHAATCPSCQATLGELGRAQDHFDAAVFARGAEALVVRRTRARWRFWLAWLAPLPLAAAALALFVLPREREGMRSKGPGDVLAAPALEIYARRGDRVWPVRAGEAVAPGDQLRFVVSRSPELTHLLIVSVTSDGGSVVYHASGAPGAEAAVALTGPARRIELPGSVVIDERRGSERVYLLLDRRPFTLAPLLPSLRAGGPVGVAASVTVELTRARR